MRSGTTAAPEPIFLETRRDRQTDLGLGVSYLLRAPRP